jgi:ABC-2 type transport system ATP-binding protein
MVMNLWLAIAWLRGGPVLLLSEPTHGLDAQATARLHTQILGFRDRRVAVIVLTADVLFASQVADRLAILKRGVKVSERTRAEVLSLSLTELYIDFVGQPPSRSNLDALRVPTGR